MGPVGISLGLHAVGLAAGLYLWTAAPVQAPSPGRTLQVGALVECIAPGLQECTDLCTQEGLPELHELVMPEDPFVRSSADELTTSADIDLLALPPVPGEAQVAPAPHPFFEVPLDAIRIHVQPEPSAAPELPPRSVSRNVSRGAANAARGAALRVLSQPNVLNYYPLEARRRGLEGRVLVLIQVDTHGRVTSARIIESSGSALLDRQAVRYSRAMRFHPGPGGQAKAPVHFRLS